MLPINIPIVLLAAAVNFIIGFLFHGPLFGKIWMKLANITPTGKEKFSDMVPQMIKNFLANVLFAYVLAMFIYVVSNYYHNAGSVVGGMGIAFWVWFGFIFTGSSMDVIWMGKSVKLWCFELCSALASIIAMGAIIAFWM